MALLKKKKGKKKKKKKMRGRGVVRAGKGIALDISN